MSIPPRQISTLSTSLSEQSIDALSSPAEYSHEALASLVVFDEGGLLDVPKFKQTVYLLKNWYDAVDFQDLYACCYKSLVDALYPWAPLPYEFPDGCRSVALLTPEIKHFSKLVRIAVKCLSHRVKTLTVFTHEHPGSMVLNLLQPWLLRDVRGHYPAELVEVSLTDAEGLLIETFSTTGERNSELMLWFKTTDHINQIGVDLVITTVELGREQDVPVVSIDELLA